MARKYKAPNEQVSDVAKVATEQHELLRAALTLDVGMERSITDPTAKEMLNFIQDTNLAICAAMNFYRRLQDFLDLKAELELWPDQN